jgi:signal transduction histidine kinase
VNTCLLFYVYATCYNRFEAAMNAFYVEIINILTHPPGNLTYHVVLTFSLAGTMLAALSSWRTNQFPQGRRMVIGLGLLLAIRITLFILAGVAWQGLINEHIFFPPVDRAATLISLILIIWMWDFPEPLRLADAAAWLLGLLTLTGLALDMVWWTSQGSTLDYNGSLPSLIGEAVTIVVILAGGLVLVLRKPNSWGFGLGLLGLALIGHALYLALPAPEGDYAGIVRLFQMAYYPLLLALPQRFALSAQQAASPAPPPERRRAPADPKLLESFVSVGSEDDPGKICQSLTRAVSTALLADICLLLTPPDERGEMLLQCGYDLIREESLPGGSISQRNAPLIATALNRGLPLRLPASSTSEDLRTLGNSLHLERPGHLLVTPVVTAEGKPLAGILLLSPYSNRAWTNEEQMIIANLGGPMAHLLQRNQALASLQHDLSLAQQELEIARTEAGELNNEVESLRSRLESLQDQSENNRLKAESLAALISTQGEPQPKAEEAQTDEHKSEGSRRQKILNEPTAPAAEQGFMEGELRLALEEVARLKASVSEADQRMLVLKNQMAASAPTDEQYEEIATIVQEMRQPMSSIIGYTDFLLGESVGILGALQRKFLERVKMLTDRMNRLVNELMRLSATQVNGERVYSEDGTDLYSVVEGAIAESMQGLREKEINLRVDIPESLPSVSADEDAIKQVLVNLIENAKEVTPDHGEITLRASLQGSDHQQAYILVQVTDQGGGIPGELIQRVFSRFGHADGKPIPGTGGKSSHLSIVKMLVENSGGRIWVDSQPDEGSTFSVLFPTAEVSLTNDAPGGLPA